MKGSSSFVSHISPPLPPPLSPPSRCHQPWGSDKRKEEGRIPLAKTQEKEGRKDIFLGGGGGGGGKKAFLFFLLPTFLLSPLCRGGREGGGKERGRKEKKENLPPL